jgi:hypothetical protein
MSSRVPQQEYAYHIYVASTVIRSTYALDEDTVRRLEQLAERWQVSESEALRRAILSADSNSPDDRILALDALQPSMKLSSEAADTWSRQVRNERRGHARYSGI